MERLRIYTFPLFSFNYLKLITISILSRRYNDVFGKSGMRIHNVSYLLALLKTNIVIS
jgi:hypothetical protein